MKMKAFARTGRAISEVGLGTYYDPLWIATAFLGVRRGAPKKIEALEKGLDGGVNLVDTAEIYGSEPLVARAMKGKRRDELFIATKVWSNHLRRDALKRSLERSLKRLETPYVDLYQIHFPNSRVPIGETMGAVEDMMQAGKIAHVGVSNFSLAQVEEANSALRRSQLSSVQLPYNLIDRRVETEMLPYCQREGLALLAYYPLAHGRLVASSKMGAICGRYAKTPSQVAIRWLARKDCVFPIPRASSPRHVIEDLEASGWDLSDQDALELERTYQ